MIELSSPGLFLSKNDMSWRNIESNKTSLIEKKW